MKQFFKIVFGSMLGFMIAGFIAILILLMIIAGLSSKKTTVVSQNSILKIDLNKPINERLSYSKIDFTSGGINSSKDLGLKELIENIRKAKTDNNISGIYLDARFVQCGWATLEALRNELLEFKKSGKFIMAYGEMMTQKSYYIASAADKVFLNPKGLMEFAGLNVSIAFIKNTLDKIGIEPQIFYCGKFKSATEPLRLTKMSDANRIQTTEFINDFYKHYMTNIAESRKMTFAELDSISKNLLVRHPSDALKHKLVDGLKYYDEILAELKNLSHTTKNEVKFIDVAAYDNVASIQKSNSSADRIAVVYAEGDIVDGQGDDDNIGGEKYAEIIRKIRLNNSIKALVLRVNSPGGSAFASDVIWREIKLAKQKMPVVVSMGDYAASGGYYISCAADSIFAQPNTLTGSIGVFGIIPCFENFLNDKLGITHDGVKTGKFSDLPTVTRKLNDEEKAIIQAGVDSVYSDFLSRVAEGRHQTKANIDSIAQGRVWSGSKAIGIGLVDRLGNLDNAIACAQRLAKIKDYHVVNYPSVDYTWKEVIHQLSEDKKQTMLKEELGEFYNYYEQIQQIKKWKSIQARVPYKMEF